MKQILIACALSYISAASMAQCGKSIVYLSDKAEFIDSAGNTLHKKEGKITVSVTNKDFALVHDDDEEDALKGDVTKLTSVWKDAYKNGKTTFESTLVGKKGEKTNAMVSIEGKDGKLLILVNIKTKGMIFKIIPNSYHEIKK